MIASKAFRGGEIESKIKEALESLTQAPLRLPHGNLVDQHPHLPRPPTDIGGRAVDQTRDPQSRAVSVRADDHTGVRAAVLEQDRPADQNHPHGRPFGSNHVLDHFHDGGGRRGLGLDRRLLHLDFGGLHGLSHGLALPIHHVHQNHVRDEQRGSGNHHQDIHFPSPGKVLTTTITKNYKYSLAYYKEPVNG